MKKIRLAISLVLVGCAGLTDTTPPTAQLSATPTTLTQAGSVTLKATAEDPAGNTKPSGIQKVEFFKVQGNQVLKLGEDLVAPYEHSLEITAADNGTILLSAKAHDKAGNVGTSNTAQVTINIAEPTPPDFDISVGGNLSIAQAGQSTLAISLTRKNNFAEPISLSLDKSDGSSLPEGLSATFNPNPAQNTSQLKLSVVSSVAVGTYPLRIKATGGNLTKTAAFSLSVLPQTPITVKVTARIKGVLKNISLMASQNGDEAWRSIAGNNGIYQFPVQSQGGRYGIMSVCTWPDDHYYQITVYQLTTQEQTTLEVDCGFAGGANTPSGPYRISGQVAGLNKDNPLAWVVIHPVGTSFASYNGVPAPLYEVNNIPSGPYRMFAVRYNSYDAISPTPKGNFAANRAIFQENVAVHADTTLDLDFAGPHAFALEGTYTVNVTGIDPTSLTRSLTAFYSNLSGGLFPLASTDTSSLNYPFLPLNRRSDKDMVLLGVSESYRTNTPTVIYKFRNTGEALTAPQSKTLEFLPYPQATVSATSATSYLQPKATWNAANGVWYELGFSQNQILRSQAKPWLDWKVYLSKEWVAQRQGYSLPDFSSLSGWQSVWGLRVGEELNWSIYRRGGKWTLQDYLDSQKNFDINKVALMVSSEHSLLGQPSGLSSQGQHLMLQSKGFEGLPAWLSHLRR